MTYEMFSARWPQVKGSKYMDRMNGLKKLVASRSLKDVSWNASLIEGDVAAEIARIKQQAGGDILKYGVSNLDQTLLANKLVDEYQLSIVPTPCGPWQTRFPGYRPVPGQAGACEHAPVQERRHHADLYPTVIRLWILIP
ncbi:dihydrofolate reductase family protein [Mesorhizobium sp. BHbsci]